MKTITNNILNTFISKFGVNPKYPNTFILSEKQYNCIRSDFELQQHRDASYGTWFTTYELKSYNGYDFQIYFRGSYTFVRLNPTRIEYTIIELENGVEEYKYTNLCYSLEDLEKWFKQVGATVIRSEGNTFYINCLDD